MAYSQRKTADGSYEIVIAGWEQGIAPSPHSPQGVADLKAVNISSIKGEVSLAYNRVRLDVPALTGQSGTVSIGNDTNFNLGVSVPVGTWILVSSVSGAGVQIQNSHYYQVITPTVGTTYTLTDGTAGGFPGTKLSATTTTGTFTWQSVSMGVPVDYCTEFSPNGYRYYVLDQNGIVWVSGTQNSPGSAGTLTATSTFSAITPQGTSTNAFDSGSIVNGSLAVIPTTNSTNVITKTWLGVFGDNNIYFFRSDDNSGFPSVTGSVPGNFDTYQYQGSSRFHKAIFGNDQTLYWSDGPTVSILRQTTGQLLSLTHGSVSGDTYTKGNYLLAPTDNATRIAVIPSGASLSIVVGGTQNNLYVYPTYQNSTTSGAAPTSVLWMPESNTQYLLLANNYVIIFCGNKGNIYLTNGSSVVPLLTVPDYIAGSANFIQDPYFVWGGAAYLRGRIFFSIQDSNSSHTGNCGGIWSFVPSFNYFPQQDSGLSLRMEAASSLYATTGFNGSAPVIFSGSELTAQEADGPQYLAAWSQTVSSTTYNSIDFSGTNPVTNSSSIIETDAVPVGTFLNRKTFKQVEVKFVSALAANESITINFRTDLESSWASAGTVILDTDRLAGITNVLTWEKAQIIQLQIVLNGTTTNPSWIRIKEIYLR